MSFAVSASATRVVASTRAPVKTRNTAVSAFAAPVVPRKPTAAKLSAKNSVCCVAGLRASRASPVARAGRALNVLAGRVETERTYIMIKPDGVQRGYVSVFYVAPCSIDVSIGIHPQSRRFFLRSQKGCSKRRIATSPS